MKDEIIVDGISEESLAAYFDGTATADEYREILDTLGSSDELAEIMSISMAVDRDLALGLVDHVEVLPISAVAAAMNNSCACSVECEKYILSLRDIEYDHERISQLAKQYNWQTELGTELHNIGRHLEASGLRVVRQYKCSIEDIVNALAADEDVIVAVDGGELSGDLTKERREDILIGEIPDHTVVVLACNKHKQTITIFDPNSPNPTDTYHIEQFRDAWEDSKNYMVTVCQRGTKAYNPSPIALDDVTLNDDINGLREAIAENAHEIWARKRMNEGWSYGPKRDDRLKQTPDMVPYAELSELEKDYDRSMAIETIKLIYKLGYDIIKYHGTELYSELRERIAHADKEATCPRCGATMYVGQRYCDRCGEKIAK